MGTAKVDLTVKTTGDGFWSKRVATVGVIRLEWYTSEPEGDLESETFVHVFFDPLTWNVEADGLLYTDKGFEEGLRVKILELVKQEKLPRQLPWQDISYTEQGMQHHDYVHMILGGW